MTAPVNASHSEPTVVEPTEVLPALGSMLEAQTRGEIDVQIATAKRFPRSVSVFKKKAMEMATLDEETAAACFYVVPRDGKNVEGPSARLAEIVASAWGHMRIEARVVDENDRFVTSRGTAWDLENNVAIAFEVRRRITNKSGRRYSDDMIGTTANAASSIALRNAVFKVVPSAFTREIYHACRKVAVGDAQTLATKRAAMLEYFQKLGVIPARVFGLLQVRGVEDITLEHMATLKGLATAIKEGDTSIEEAFPVQGAELDPLTQIVQETGCDSELAQQLLGAFEAAGMTPAQRLVQLKAHKGRAADLLKILHTPAAADEPPMQTTTVTPPASTPPPATSTSVPAATTPGAQASTTVPPATSAVPTNTIPFTPRLQPQPTASAKGSGRFSF